jgi:hypothetical protein
MMTMTIIALRFGLSERPDSGVFCSTNGLFVGGVPLLKRISRKGSREEWRLRPIQDLNRDLSKRYALPIEVNARIESLAAIVRAFNRGDLVRLPRTATRRL